MKLASNGTAMFDPLPANERRRSSDRITKLFWRLALCVPIVGVPLGGGGCGGTSVPAAGLAKPAEQTDDQRSAATGALTAAPQADSGFAFATDGAGKLLAQRLTPPRHDPPPALPFQNRPEVLAPLPLDHPPELSQLWPSASVSPQLLPSESVRKEAARPVLDLPPLSADLHRLPLPSAFYFAVQGRAYAQSPDPSALPPSGPASLERADLVNDATADLARATYFGFVEPLRRQAAPPLATGIPDPFEARRQSRPLPALEETIPPATSTDRPKIALP